MSRPLPSDARSSQLPRICLLSSIFFLITMKTSSCGILFYSLLRNVARSSSAESVSTDAGASKAASHRDVICAPTAEGPSPSYIRFRLRAPYAGCRTLNSTCAAEWSWLLVATSRSFLGSVYTRSPRQTATTR